MLLDLVPLPVRIGALVAVIVGASVAGWTVRGKIADGDIAAIRADIAQQREMAVSAARSQERRQQEIANAAMHQQAETLAGINAGLRRDLERLRNRPERPAGVSEVARPACAGATGAELSRTDAEFLVGEAARADEIRAGLAACYQVIDGVK